MDLSSASIDPGLSDRDLGTSTDVLGSVSVDPSWGNGESHNVTGVLGLAMIAGVLKPISMDSGSWVLSLTSLDSRLALMDLDEPSPNF